MRRAQLFLFAATRSIAGSYYTGDPARSTTFYRDVLGLSETPLGDLRRAGAHYQEALNRAPDHVPSIRGARRVLIARKSYQAALALFDAEVRITSDPRKKAALHLIRELLRGR